MEPKMNACGVLLAGGRSSRMGREKALLELDGEPLIQRLARRLEAWFEQVVVVANTAELFSFLALPVVPDLHPGLGPLAGLEAGLAASRHEHAFFCACDMPFVDERLVRHLLSLTPEHDVVVPRIGKGYEPMHAVYARRCLPLISHQLSTGHLRLFDLYDRLRVRKVPESAIREFGDPDRLFFNCNTPDDLLRARRWD